MAVIMPEIVILSVVMSSSSSAASSTIAAPILPMSTISPSASSPPSTPPDTSSMPACHSAAISPSDPAVTPPVKTCTSAPMVTLSSIAHVTRSTTGRPSCSSRMIKPIKSENGSMYSPAPISPRNRTDSTFRPGASMPKHASAAQSPSSRHTTAPTSRRMGRFAFAARLPLRCGCFAALRAAADFFVCFLEAMLFHLMQRATGSASPDPRPSSNMQIRRTGCAASASAADKWRDTPTRTPPQHPPNTSANTTSRSPP